MTATENPGAALEVPVLKTLAIEVLDASRDGAFFGANALAALQADHGPLAGLDIGMRHQDYDWDHPAALARLVEKLVSAGRTSISRSMTSPARRTRNMLAWRALGMA